MNAPLGAARPQEVGDEAPREPALSDLYLAFRSRCGIGVLFIVAAVALLAHGQLQQSGSVSAVGLVACAVGGYLQFAARRNGRRLVRARFAALGHESAESDRRARAVLSSWLG